MTGLPSSLVLTRLIEPSSLSQPRVVIRWPGSTGLANFGWRNLAGAALFGVGGSQAAPTAAINLAQSSPATGVIALTADATIQLEVTSLVAFTSLSGASAFVEVIA